MASVLVMMVAAVGINTMTHLQGTNANLYRKQAKHAAYGGIQWALASLAKDSTWEPSPKPFLLDLTGHKDVTVEILVYNNNHGALGANFRAPDGTLVPRGATYIITMGKAADQRSISTSAMSTLAFYGDELPTTALFADQKLELSDSMTDSWISFSENNRHKYELSEHTSEATVGTNASESGVVLHSSRVLGGLLLGSGAQRDAALVALEGSSILGQTTTQTDLIRVQAHKPPEWLESRAEAELPAVEKGGALEPGSYDTVRAGKGETIRLSSGSYYVRSSLSLDGARLVIDPPGPVTLYVGGELKVSGGSRINPDDTGPDTVTAGASTSGLPGNLDVQMVGNGNLSVRPTFEMSDQSKAWMSVSGRTLAGAMNNSELFGSLKGEVLQLKSSKVHLDRATRTTGVQQEQSTVVPSATAVSELDPKAASLVQLFPQQSDTSTVTAAVSNNNNLEVCAPGTAPQDVTSCRVTTSQ